MCVCCLFTHTALLNNIGLVLHNQTWHTRHVIVVHMKLSALYSMHSTSRSCPLCNFYMSLYNWQFFNLLVSCLFCLLLAEIHQLLHHFKLFSIHWWEISLIRNNDGLLGRIKHVYSSPLLLILQPNSFSPCIYMHGKKELYIYPDCDKCTVMFCNLADA